ncbi:aldehyde dehydrogenase [Pueribacillus theae]|uniref:3-sulfolactaldehyde dehydrogenase n=1 Tax=Pueribacillus theae TaxID=2171751 RepID=A0A2U1JJR7_9BACI|nr:aldehyde dehydrogenase family protein [Pueribacillus theae]PWA05118.1 aldehyde dehydrogenase [Pueribacillus theae]
MGSYSQWKQMPLGGVWREGNSDSYYENKNPYNNELLVRIKLANNEDIDEAFFVANKVQKEWAQTTAEERSKVMLKAIKLFEERREEFAKILVEESGSTIKKANFEIDTALRYIKEASEFPFKMESETLDSTIKGKKNKIFRIPVGIVSVITPWNFPFNLAIRSVAPALATGNAVILKPDNQTAISGGSFIAKVFEDAGVPKGLISVIIADLKEIGDAVIEHPLANVVSFTGSSKAGKHIASVASKHLKKATLELGGNNAFVVLDDADLDKAVSASIFGKFMHQGQICMSINRIIVDRKVSNEFISKFKSKVEKLTTGDPMSNETNIGPLINKNQINQVNRLVQTSIEEGATVVVKGDVKNNTISPWVLTDVTSEMTIAQEEIFGPIAVIIPVDGEEEAIRVANDTKYGLVGSVFTEDINRGLAFAEKMDCGMFHINDATVNSEPGVPFGGEKDSGLGRHGGEWSIDEFTTVKWVSIQNEARNYPLA